MSTPMPPPTPAPPGSDQRPALSPGARSAATVIVLVVLLALGLLWGWSAVTKPLPRSSDPTEPCVPTPVTAGSTVVPDQVLVSVLNASTRDGLAARTMQALTDVGFAAGNRGNAPRGTRVSRAQVWTSEPNNPAVRLVRSYLGDGVEVVDTPTTAAGVVVVVGNRFDDLAEGRAAAPVRADAVICSPPGA